MKPIQGCTAQDIAQINYLAVRYPDDLPDKVAGFLEPNDEPTYIAVNAGLPQCEQAFTIAHELAHYFLHRNPGKAFLPQWYVRYESPWRRVNRILATHKRFVSFKFNLDWQADLWAICLLASLRAENKNLQTYILRHPEKLGLFILAACLMSVKGFARMIWRFVRKLAAPFSLT